MKQITSDEMYASHGWSRSNHYDRDRLVFVHSPDGKHALVLACFDEIRMNGTICVLRLVDDRNECIRDFVKRVFWEGVSASGTAWSDDSRYFVIPIFLRWQYDYMIFDVLNDTFCVVGGSTGKGKFEGGKFVIRSDTRPYQDVLYAGNLSDMPFYPASALPIAAEILFRTDSPRARSDVGNLS